MTYSQQGPAIYTFPRPQSKLVLTSYTPPPSCPADEQYQIHQEDLVMVFPFISPIATPFPRFSRPLLRRSSHMLLISGQYALGLTHPAYVP